MHLKVFLILIAASNTGAIRYFGKLVEELSRKHCFVPIKPGRHDKA